MLTTVLFFAFSIICDLASATILVEYNIFSPLQYISSEKVLPNRPKQEISLPERLAEGSRHILNGKVGEPAVSQILDAPVPQRRFPLSPDRWSGYSEDDR